VPCIELEVDEKGVLEISLIENLQRRDLDPFEEGDAIFDLCERFNYTHEKVAQKLGKSRTSITEILSVAGIPDELREICRRADISSKSLLVEIARQPTPELMRQFVERIARDRLTRDDARRLRAVPPPDGPESEPAATAKDARSNVVLKLSIEDFPATVQLRFQERGEVRKPQVIAALQALIRRVEASNEIPD
jgi:ParB family chromosome partitioning protein